MPSRSLLDLTDAAKIKCLLWLDACKRDGIDVLVYCTYRSREEQAELYKIGRTVKGADVSILRPMGRKVTNAKPGESFHEYRCAWDAVPLVAGKPAWDAEATYKRMAALAKPFGIEWAGDWKGFKEQAHFQYTGGLSLVDLQSGRVVV